MFIPRGATNTWQVDDRARSPGGCGPEHRAPGRESARKRRWRGHSGLGQRGAAGERRARPGRRGQRDSPARRGRVPRPRRGGRGLRVGDRDPRRCDRHPVVCRLRAHRVPGSPGRDVQRDRHRHRRRRRQPVGHRSHRRRGGRPADSRAGGSDERDRRRLLRVHGHTDGGRQPAHPGRVGRRRPVLRPPVGRRADGDGRRGGRVHRARFTLGDSRRLRRVRSDGRGDGDRRRVDPPRVAAVSGGGLERNEWHLGHR